MVLALKVAAALALVLVLAVVALRVRKLRRDQIRELSRSVERRLVSPPPSPYTPSKGFRLLESEDSLAVRPAPARPRLDPQRHYVFSDSAPPGAEDVVPTTSRHDQEWLLQRSSSRSSFVGVGPVALAVLVVVFIIAAIVLYARHHPPAKPATTTTTSTTSASTTTSAHSLGAGGTYYVAFL